MGETFLGLLLRRRQFRLEILDLHMSGSEDWGAAAISSTRTGLSRCRRPADAPYYLCGQHIPSVFKLAQIVSHFIVDSLAECRDCRVPVQADELF
ncbi:MAG: hypothetical protein CMM61_16370 [Rhodospirillaceae bacterium]|nr:hypothetical protein [Rhodospirillaceae bacterium]